MNDSESRAKPNKGILAAQAEQRRRKAAGLPIGRPKGVPNKLTEHVRTAVLRTYDRIGGDEAFAEWAAAHRTDFYNLMVKLAPKEREANARGTGIVVNIAAAADLRPIIEVERADSE